MADENSVPETLESIAAKLGELAKRFDAVDDRFGKIESRITKEIAETRSQLGVKIEAVHSDVKLVYDEVVRGRT